MSATWSSGARAPQKPVLTMASAGNPCRAASTAEAAHCAPTPLATSTSWWSPRRAERDQATGTAVDCTSVRCPKMPGNSMRSAATMRILMRPMWRRHSCLPCRDSSRPGLGVGASAWVPPLQARVPAPRRAGELALGLLFSLSCGRLTDRPQTRPTKPCDGASERLVGRRRAEAEFALRLGVRHPHFLLRHADRVKRHARRMARDAGPRATARSGAVCHQIRKAEGGRLSAGDARQLLEDLRQGEILRAQDIALPVAPALAGLPMA